MKKRTMKMRKIAGLSRRLAALMMIVVFALSGTALTGCGSDNKTAQNTSGDAKQYDGKLEFDHTMELKYAKLFKVDYYKGGYKMLTITNRDEDTAIVDKETKLLIVPDGMSTPSVDSNVIVLKAPVTNMLVSSTPVTSLMNASNCLSNISQVTYNKDEWYIDDVKKAFDNNKLTYIGNYKEPDYELIVAGAPSIAVYSTMLSSVPEVAAKLKEIRC